MLLFDYIPRGCKKQLNHNCGPLTRTQRYKYFENGRKGYKHEINIVEVLRTLRYYNAAVEKLLKNQPKKILDELLAQKNRMLNLATQ